MYQEVVDLREVFGCDRKGRMVGRRESTLKLNAVVLLVPPGEEVQKPSTSGKGQLLERETTGVSPSRAQECPGKREKWGPGTSSHSRTVPNQLQPH